MIGLNAMLASGAVKTFVLWRESSRRAVPDKKTTAAILRAAVLVGMVVGGFIALMCGLGIGISWSTLLAPPDKGVMDSPG